MKKKKMCFGYIGLIVYMIATMCANAEESAMGSLNALGLNSIASAKILQHSLVDRLDRGENAVDVIILLKGYKKYIGKIKASKSAEMKSYQAEIRSNQDQVLIRLNRADFKLRHQFDNISGFSGTVNRAAFNALALMPEVESIEEDGKAQAQLAQGIPLMKGSQVRSSFNGAGVSIAIVDTGIDYTHSMLGSTAFPNAKVIGGYDFGDADANPMDCHGHGTSVAGIAAGDLATGPGSYIGGVAHNAKLYALKIVSGCSSSSSYSTIAAAWDWALSHKYDNPSNPILIINTSFGGGPYLSACDSSQPTLATAASNAVANGITLFSASGNNGYTNAIAAPACVTNSLSVGAVYDANIGSRSWIPCTDATTAPDKVTCYSNSANFLNILAPSNDAYTTAVGGVYTSTFGGTSAATPYAAGAGAVLQSSAKTVTGQFYPPSTLKARLINTGDQITDSKNGIAKPRVNIGAAAKIYSRIAPGWSHAVAMKPEGTLWAWGDNSFGQLGDGTTVAKLYPVQIGAGSTWVSVASGWNHSLSIKSDGTLWVWGHNEYGQLGDGTTVSKSTPVQIGAGSTWVKIAAGAQRSVAVKSDGTLWSWGYGGASSPVQVGTGNAWASASVAVGWAHNMALKTDGTLWAWGGNNTGQLGDGSTVDKSVPVQIGAGSTWISVATGEFHTAAVKSDGSAWTWGYNYYGQLGDGTTVNQISPKLISALNTSVAAGEFHTVAVKSNGTLSAWGNNYYGQLGDGTTINRLVPVQIGTGNTWVTIAGNYYQTAAMKADGTLWAWGYNSSGQLGDGTLTDRNSPTQANGNGRLLVVTKAGTGTGSVTSSASGINCGADCGDGFPLGSQVTLTVAPDAGAGFAGWSGGGCSGTNLSCTVTMNDNISVTATFNLSGDVYGGWEVCSYDDCGYPLDTCNSDVYSEFACPSGASFSCVDAASSDPYLESSYRSVTCVP